MENVRSISVQGHPAEDDAERVLILARHPAEVADPTQMLGRGELELNRDEAEALHAELGTYLRSDWVGR